MNYEEIRKDLFEMDDSYVLAHCISKDCKMGAGIATEFVKRYPNMKKKLIAYGPEIGDAISYSKDGRIIFNLITKENYWDKPTYDTFTQTLIDLRDDMEKLKVKKLAIPQLGAGLDKLDWNKNRKIIQDVFKNTNIEIVVCLWK